jgi:uncharacterized membrane protein
VRVAIPLVAGLFALSAPSWAADPTKPHPHQGVSTKFSNPARTALSAAEEAQLASGKAVRKQVRHDSGGRGVAIQDVQATEAEVWAVIRDFNSYPNWISNLETCKVYKVSGEHTFVEFEISALGMGVGYYIDHTYKPSQGTMTWQLDYSRTSDLDDSTGYWLVYPAPGRDGYTRVEYTVDLRMSGWVPKMVEDMLANKGLEQATSWVKKQAEA